MQPTLSFWNNFSDEGRTKQLWARALKETDPEKSLALLRSVLLKLSQPPALPHLWLPFLDTLLAGERVHLLNTSDLTSIQKMGQFLQQTPGQHQAPPASAIWQRLLNAHTRRGEDKLVRDLAIKIYEDKSIDEKTRSSCVRVLARQELLDDRYLDIYMAHLRSQVAPQEEAEIFHTLNLLLTIDFNASDARLRSVHRVAQFLFGLKTPALQAVPARAWTAEGIYALIYKAAPQEARTFFTHASALPGEQPLAYLGLLACALRQGDEAEAARLAQSAEVRALARQPDFAALLELQQMFQWLYHPELSTLRQPDAGWLTAPAALGLQRLAGVCATFVLGCAYLLSGEAKLASAQFETLLKKGLSQPEWGYYAAWAFALCGEGQRVVECFKLQSNWPGRWTIACLLLDLSPRLAEQAGALALLKKLAATTESAAAVVRTRLALALVGGKIGDEVSLAVVSSLPEKLETLRTILASSVARKAYNDAANLVLLPLFIRLPRADQTFWLGLCEREEGRRLSLLQRAADTWQYQRAALYLVVAALHQGNWSRANLYLGQALAGRADLRAQLIQLYLAGHQERGAETIQRAEQLVALGEARAGYILGNLALYQAATLPEQAQSARLQAALAWQRLLESTQDVPADLAARAACAAFIAYPQQRALNAQLLIARFQELESAFHQPWLEWHVALAHLWYGTSQALNTAYPLLQRVIELASRASALTVAALLQALARFSPGLQDSAARQHLLELMARLARLNQEATDQRQTATALVTAQRTLYQTADRQERARIEADARNSLEYSPRNELFLLWLASIVLSNGQREEARQLLSGVSLDDPATTRFAQALSEILAHRTLTSTAVSGDTLLPSSSRAALEVARTMLSGQLEEGYELLLSQASTSVLATWRIERLLPALCRHLRQKNSAPPAFLASCLYNQRLLSLDSAALVDLAWCASFLGEGEQACRFWEEALRKSADDERHAGWRQDFVRFLCRQAVSEFQAKQPLAAADKLKLAAHWTLAEAGQQTSQARLLEHARTLETRALSMLLLTYQFPDFDVAALVPGRYHVLGVTILHYPQLCAALISRDRERIQQEWNQTLQAQQQNIRFLHALSLIYREVALSRQRQRIDTEKDWFTSTSLWILLLSTQDFWRYFTTARDSEIQGEPRKLSPQQQEELWQDALENILAFHSSIARKSLAANQHGQARIHARSLALGRQSKDTLLAQLQAVNLSFPASIDEQRLDQIKGRTQKLLNEWGQALVADAEKSVNDARRIQELPEGIRKYYAGGIGILEPFIRLDVPLPHVLLVCLEWYNEWCYDLRLKQFWAQCKERVEAADQICSRLQRRCNPKNIYNAENKAIARHLLQYGLALEKSDPARALHFFEEAQTWGSDDPSLSAVLDETRFENARQAARACSDKQQFEEAYQLIDQAQALLTHSAYAEPLRELRMQISYHHGRELARQGKYTEALSRSKQALALVPGNSLLQQFVREMEALLPEEGHAQALHAAETALAEQDFARVFQHLARIAPGSRSFEQAEEIKKQARVQQQEQLAREKEAQPPEPPETSNEKELRLRAVLEKSEDGLKRARAREELSGVLAERATEEVGEINKLNQMPDALRHSRLIYARALLEEALELDARNPQAKQLLAKLNAEAEKKAAENKGTQKKSGGKA